MKKTLFLCVLCFLMVVPTLGCTGESGLKDINYKIDEKWFAAKKEKYAKIKPHNMKMGVSTSLIVGEGVLTRKDFDNYPLAIATINAAIETGVDVLRVGVVDDAWIKGNNKEIELGDRLVKMIKEKGISLFLWDWQYSSVLNKNKVSWEEYKVLHLKKIEFFINRYGPDYYSIVTEPTATGYYKIRERVSLKQWFDYIQEMAEYLKGKYPRLKLAVLAVPGEDDAFLQGVLAVEGIDIVGIEIYYPRHVDALETYLEEYHPHRYGKEIWLLETWNGMPYPFTAVQSKEKEDIEWLRMLLAISSRNAFDGFMPWPWLYFVSYDKNLLMQAKPDYSGRTAVFEAYREMVRSSGG